MEDTPDNKILSASLLRLRVNAPFFAFLTLFARVRFDPTTPTAATDGRDIFWNPTFLAQLQPAEVDGVMLHEILHTALLHVPRCGDRDPVLWNIAADIVVNGIIAETAETMPDTKRFTLPASAVRDPALEKFSVEEVYELLRANGTTHRLLRPDLRPMPEGARKEDLEAHWRNAQVQARNLVSSQGRGTMPAGFERELANLEPAQVDWRSRLWRFLVRTPTDFSGFDRRFIGQGLYVETLEGESLHVYVAIDTSGSVGDAEMGQFLGELQGILRAYPHIVCDLFYADAEVHGPYRLTSDGTTTLPRPVGGGGTDFRPFFARVAELREQNPVSLLSGAGAANVYSQGGQNNSLCVYLTDGYGVFPEEPFSLPTLWVVTPGGADWNAFPFGETVRLLIHS